MTLRLAALLIALLLSPLALADTQSKDSPYLETDSTGRGLMP